MRDLSFLHAGLIGTVVAMACCLAPILLGATSVIGVGALTAAIYGLSPYSSLLSPLQGTSCGDIGPKSESAEGEPYVRLLRATYD